MRGFEPSRHFPRSIRIWSGSALPRSGSACAGFTMLELCLAVAIGLMLLGLAVPSVKGVFSDQKRQASLERFDDLAHQAQRLSVEQRRGYRLVWEKDAIVLVGDSAAPALRAVEQGGGALLGAGSQEREGGTDEVGRVPIGRGEEYRLERPVALAEQPAKEWVFWRGGICEPVVVSYEGPSGRWRVRYDALTGRGAVLGEDSK